MTQKKLHDLFRAVILGLIAAVFIIAGGIQNDIGFTLIGGIALGGLMAQ